MFRSAALKRRLRTVPLRVLRLRTRLFYLVASLGLSFGLIAVTASIAHATWFRLPAGVAAQDYVTILRQTEGGVDLVSQADFENLENIVPAVSWIFSSAPIAVQVRDAKSGRLRTNLVREVSNGFFNDMGVIPTVGSMRPVPMDAPAVVISHALWHRAYASTDDLSDAAVYLSDGRSYPIVAVAPPQFSEPFDVTASWWIQNAPPGLETIRSPIGIGTDTLKHRMPTLTIFGVIAHDSRESLSSIRAKLADYRFATEPVFVELDISNRTEQGIEPPKTVSVMIRSGFKNSDRMTVINGLETSPGRRSEVLEKTAWLIVIALLLLAMTFVSLVDYLLAEAASRNREHAIRIAIGATTVDLVGQTASMNAPWVVVIGVLTWLTFLYVSDLLLGILPFSDYLREIPLDAQIAGLVAAGMLLGISFALSVSYVGWYAVRTSRAFGHSQSSVSSTITRATQSVLLSVAVASLFFVFSLGVRYMGEARLSLGVNSDVLIMSATSKDMDPKSLASRPSNRSILDAIETIPAVESVAAARMIPFDSPRFVARWSGNLIGEVGLEDTTFYQNAVTPQFFSTLGAKLLAGRVFADDGEVVLARSTATALAGGVDDALGRPVRFVDDRNHGVTDSVPSTVVGIVEDVPYGDYIAPVHGVIYTPLSQATGHRWLVSLSGDMALIAESIRQLPVFDGFDLTTEGTPHSLFQKQFLGRRSVEILLAGAGAFALLLALVGVTNSLVRAVFEAHVTVGIRFALGATAKDVAWGFWGGGLRDLVIAVLAVAIGGLFAKLTAPTFASPFQLWILLPVSACLLPLLTLTSYMVVREMAVARSIGALIDGFPTTIGADEFSKTLTFR